jgi:hypothetical protein
MDNPEDQAVVAEELHQGERVLLDLHSKDQLVEQVLPLEAVAAEAQMFQQEREETDLPVVLAATETQILLLVVLPHLHTQVAAEAEPLVLVKLLLQVVQAAVVRVVRGKLQTLHLPVQMERQVPAVAAVALEPN